MKNVTTINVPTENKVHIEHKYSVGDEIVFDGSWYLVSDLDVTIVHGTDGSISFKPYYVLTTDDHFGEFTVRRTVDRVDEDYRKGKTPKFKKGDDLVGKSAATGVRTVEGYRLGKYTLSDVGGLGKYALSGVGRDGSKEALPSLFVDKHYDKLPNEKPTEVRRPRKTPTETLAVLTQAQKDAIVYDVIAIITSDTQSLTHWLTVDTDKPVEDQEWSDYNPPRWASLDPVWRIVARNL